MPAMGRSWEAGIKLWSPTCAARTQALERHTDRGRHHDTKTFIGWFTLQMAMTAGQGQSQEFYYSRAPSAPAAIHRFPRWTGRHLEKGDSRDTNCAHTACRHHSQWLTCCVTAGTNKRLHWYLTARSDARPFNHVLASCFQSTNFENT